MLVAEGRLVAADGGYAPAGDLTNLAVPETLHALIAARLDALPGAERSVIQDAAVLGQSFTLDGLAAVSSLDRDQVDELAGSLVRRELLTHDVDPRSPERGQYAFVQALIREVAYGTLARRDRRTRHLAAARFFECARRGGARGRPRVALPGCVPRRARRSRQPAARDPGADRAPRRRHPRQLARQQ